MFKKYMMWLYISYLKCLEQQENSSIVSMLAKLLTKCDGRLGHLLRKNESHIPQRMKTLLQRFKKND